MRPPPGSKLTFSCRATFPRPISWSAKPMARASRWWMASSAIAAAWSPSADPSRAGSTSAPSRSLTASKARRPWATKWPSRWVAYGARVTLVDGLISDCGRMVAERGPIEGWFDVSTLKEPYRIEGKKTMGYEVAEQMGWELPEAIFYPTGGGVGMIGMWKAFDEMEKLGWIGSRRPKMIAVQATGCAPIVRAFEENEPRSRFF